VIDIKRIFLIVFLSLPACIQAQELEPRALTNVPVGTNFVVVGYAYARGNTLLDPALPLENLESRVHTVVGAYVRAISLFGMSGKVDVVVPFAFGNWEGIWQGRDSSRKIDGFGDPRIRLSVNFRGAPALKWGEIGNYDQGTILGAIVQVIVPVGQYDSSKMINLGSNRWTFRTQIGVSQKLKRWLLEAYAAVWLFTPNNDFWGGFELKQRPLFVGKVHLIRTLQNGMWLAIGVGYGAGGRTMIDNAPKDTRISAFRFGVTIARPLGRGHTLKLGLISGARLERGADFDAVALTYQYGWGGK
jgi:hypothetical protein